MTAKTWKRYLALKHNQPLVAGVLFLLCSMCILLAKWWLACLIFALAVIITFLMLAFFIFEKRNPLTEVKLTFHYRHKNCCVFNDGYIATGAEEHHQHMIVNKVYVCSVIGRKVVEIKWPELNADELELRELSECQRQYTR